jgi:hypothetical protein
LRGAIQTLGTAGDAGDPERALSISCATGLEG